MRSRAAKIEKFSITDHFESYSLVESKNIPESSQSIVMQEWKELYKEALNREEFSFHTYSSKSKIASGYCNYDKSNVDLHETFIVGFYKGKAVKLAIDVCLTSMQRKYLFQKACDHNNSYYYNEDNIDFELAGEEIRLFSGNFLLYHMKWDDLQKQEISYNFKMSLNQDGKVTKQGELPYAFSAKMENIKDKKTFISADLVRKIQSFLVDKRSVFKQYPVEIEINLKTTETLQDTLAISMVELKQELAAFLIEDKPSTIVKNYRKVQLNEGRQEDLLK